MKKENRIKKNEEIAKIVLKKQKIKSDSFFIYYQKSNTITRVAISVSKKYGNAVKRNHAKRVVRELIRPEISKIVNCVDLVIVVKNDFIEKTFIDLQKEMIQCLIKIENRLKIVNNERK